MAASLYYAVTGEYPTKSSDRKDNDEELVPPQRWFGGISDGLNQAILQGMALEAENRPQSIEAWLALLIPYESDTDNLSSEVGVDYRRLRDLLKAGNWKEADKETNLVMCKTAHREKEGYLNDVKDYENFPCTDLRTIDRLWVKYSNGRFGFSVQNRIWESVGGTPDANVETYCRFGNKVGWRVKEEWLDYNQLTFQYDAPQGHLPLISPLLLRSARLVECF